MSTTPHSDTAPFKNCALSTCLMGALLLAFIQEVSAQNSTELMATYGRGVHAYFGGQMHEADRLLSQAINGGTTDPRVFYFRAMARMRTGRTYEAEADMQVGASFEAQNPGYGSTISRSLQRVQGPNRRKLEEFRRQARLDQVGQRRSKNRNRYEQLKRREPKVLRNEVNVPLEELTGSGSSSRGAATTTKPTGALPPRPTPAVPPGPADSSDPFGEIAEPEDDVFGDPSSSGEAEAAEDDPFGSAESEDEDPFGSTDSEDEDPFGSSDAAEDDPFSSTGDTEDKQPLAVTSESSGSVSTPGQLGEDEKVSADAMVGILGRIAAGLNPARGIELPMPPVGPGMGAPAGVDFGPGDDFGDADSFGDADNFGDDDSFGSEDGFAQSMDSDEEDDPFADDSGSPFGAVDAGDDSFGFGGEESTEPSETASSESEPADDFGDDDPFAF